MTDTLAELREVRRVLVTYAVSSHGTGEAFFISYPVQQALSTLDKIIMQQEATPTVSISVEEYKDPLAFLDAPETVEEVAEIIRATWDEDGNHSAIKETSSKIIEAIKRLAGGRG